MTQLIMVAAHFPLYQRLPVGYSIDLNHAAHEIVQCGPQTLGKMKILKEILCQLVYFLKNIGYWLQKNFFIF